MKKKYRKNVGIVVFKKDKVLVFARADQKGLAWQFPQGGVNENENLFDAATRELFEETGITNTKFVTKTPFFVRYDLPSDLIRNNKRGFCGQEQVWFLFEFLGEDNEINFFVNPEEIEFKSFEWVEPKEAIDRIVEFKKDVYKKVINYFADFIGEK